MLRSISRPWRGLLRGRQATDKRSCQSVHLIHVINPEVDCRLSENQEYFSQKVAHFTLSRHFSWIFRVYLASCFLANRRFR